MVERIRRVRGGQYGDRVVAVEPGGAEFIPLSERHGHPLQLFWTWTSPNLEFATIFVGVLAVAVFGLGFWQAAAAILWAARSVRHARHLVDARALRGCAADGDQQARVRVLGQRAACWAERGDRRHRLVRGEQRERRVRAEHPHPPAQGRVPGHRRRAAGRRSPSSATTWCTPSSATPFPCSPSSSSSHR